MLQHQIAFTEVNSGSCQIPKMQLFAKTVKGCYSYLFLYKVLHNIYHDTKLFYVAKTNVYGMQRRIQNPAK